MLHAPACGALEGVFGLPSRQGCSPVGGRDQGASGSWSLRVGHFFPTLVLYCLPRDDEATRGPTELGRPERVIGAIRAVFK
jgi:hypothetical protein